LITDTGSGIRPEDCKAAVRAILYHEIDQGHWLGLWISKGIVQKYQGIIRFRSIRLFIRGNITVFSVFIPKSASSQMPSRAWSRARHIVIIRRGTRSLMWERDLILCVDDEENQLAVRKLVLERRAIRC
jgi:hypothetical protein